MSIIVGAGFSRNSVPIGGESKSFPTWTDLAKKMLIGLYPDATEDFLTRNEIKCEVPAHITKISQEYKEMFGRPALEELIRQSIPDNEFQPGPLHSKLLSLPFKDVFTTNYDTLLDRAAKENYERKYSVISTVGELTGSYSPRIIKLHGSFPNITPFVITEEDYRTYPQKYKPFINTVIQSILENTLILIGFSGEDPNFLQWVGWIRDELEDSRQKIYICAHSDSTNFSEAQKRLFNARGIEVLDLSLRPRKCDEFNHDKSLEWFLQKLKEGERKPSPRDWPFIRLNRLRTNDPENSRLDKSKIANDLCVFLSAIRKDYPGWILAPNANRSKINSYVLDDYLDQLGDIFQAINDLSKSMQLIDNSFWIKHILLESFFGKPIDSIKVFIENALESIEKNVKRQNDKLLIINILIYLYIDARENYELELMDSYKKKIFSIGFISVEQKDWFRREEVMLLFQKGDYGTAKQELDQWPISDEKASINMLFKSSFYCEIGDYSEAANCLKNALQFIRLNWIESIASKSYEGFCIYMLKMIEDKRGNGDNEEQLELQERLGRLGLDQCNPQSQIRDLASKIPSFKIPTNPVQDRVKKYDPFSYTSSYKISSSPTLTYENRFINLFNYAPIPTRGRYWLPTSEMVFEKAVDFYIRRQPLFALPLMTRFRSAKMLKNILSRIYIFSLSEDVFRTIEDNYCDSLKQTIYVARQQHGQVERDAWIPMIVFLLEMISRLVARSRTAKLGTIANIALQIIEQQPFPYVDDLDEHVDNLLKRICDRVEFFNKDNVEVLNRLVNLPISETRIRARRSKYPNLPDSLPDSLGELSLQLSVSESLVQSLLNYGKDKDAEMRSYAIIRLQLYSKMGKLSDVEETTLKDIIWEQRDPKTGLPLNTNLQAWVFFEYQRDEVDRLEIAKHIKKKLGNFPFEDFMIPSRSNGGLLELEEIVDRVMELAPWFGNSHSMEELKWDGKEKRILIEKLLKSWSRVKSKLEKEERSLNLLVGMPDLQARYSKLMRFYSVFVFPFVTISDKERKILREIFLALKERKIYSYELLLLCQFNNGNGSDEEFLSGMCSTEEEQKNAVISASVYWIASLKYSDMVDPNCTIIEELIDIIESRRQPGLYISLNLAGFVCSIFPTMFSEVQLKRLVFGVKQLEKEASIPQGVSSLSLVRSSIFQSEEIPDYRALASALVYELYKNSKRNASWNGELQTLKGIFSDDPLPEVRSPWVSKIR